MAKVSVSAPLRAMELFAGVGGFRAGLEGLGTQEHPSDGNFEVVFSNQFEPRTTRQHASEVYVHRFGDAGHSNEDIAAVVNDPNKFAQILSARPEVLVGGFPCQDYSVANGNAQGLAGAKGALWWSIEQCLRQLKDAGQAVKYLLLENVDRLLKSPTLCRGQDFATILSSLSALGYAVEWRVVNAADYGFAQARQRVFIMAYHSSTAVYSQIVKGTSAVYCSELDTLHAAQWLTTTGVVAKALPVATAMPTKMHSFELGSDFQSTAASYHPHANGASQFENCGVMVNGTVYTYKSKAAAFSDYAAFLGAGNVAARTLGDVVAQTTDVPEEFYLDESSLKKWREYKGAKTKARVSEEGHAYTYSEGAVRFPDPLERPSRTIITGEGGAAASRFKHVVNTLDGRMRRLTAEELEALNGFPRGFTDVAGFSATKRAFFMGNALVVGIVAALGRALATRVRSLEPVEGSPASCLNARSGRRCTPAVQILPASTAITQRSASHAYRLMDARAKVEKHHVEKHQLRGIHAVHRRALRRRKTVIAQDAYG